MPGGYDSVVKTLNQEAIVLVALDIARQKGLPAVTMRAVAGHFGVTAMALYRHVADREELARLVVDRIGSHIRPAAPQGDAREDDVAGDHTTDHADWDDRARAWARAQRTVLRQYPGTAAWLIENGPAGPQAYRLLENLAAALAGSGLDDARTARGTALIMSWTFSRVAVEDRAGPPRGERADTFVGGLTTIDPERHPVTARIGQEFFTLDDEEIFETGLNWILAGLGADAAAT
nr:TetR/AcrR family transcriptional regulator [Kineosporia mesophila]